MVYCENFLENLFLVGLKNVSNGVCHGTMWSTHLNICAGHFGKCLFCEFLENIVLLENLNWYDSISNVYSSLAQTLGGIM